MKRLFFAVLATALLASAVHAGPGLYLRVGDCAAGTNVQSINNDCSRNDSLAIDLVASCVPPWPYDDFVGAVTIIDVWTSVAALPDWWRTDGSGCRSGASFVTYSRNIASACGSVWDQFELQPPLFAVQPFIGGPNRVRFNTGCAVTTSATVPGNGVDEFAVVRLQIRRAKSTGTGRCAGCTTDATIVLDEINFQAWTIDVPWLRITNPVEASSNVVSYTGSAFTPTRNRTWGAVKALYR